MVAKSDYTALPRRISISIAVLGSKPQGVRACVWAWPHIDALVAAASNQKTSFLLSRQLGSLVDGVLQLVTVGLG